MTDPSEESPGVDWKGVTLEMTQQILKQGEAYLQSQLNLAIASDQRATTAASILLSVATAVAAAFIAFWDKSQNEAVLLAGLAGSAVLMLSGGFAAWAARPTDFHTPGNHPAQWYEGRLSDLPKMIGGEAESVQRRIEKNDKLMRGNQRFLTFGLLGAMLAPVASVCVWYVAN